MQFTIDGPPSVKSDDDAEKIARRFFGDDRAVRVFIDGIEYQHTNSYGAVPNVKIGCRISGTAWKDDNG